MAARGPLQTLVNIGKIILPFASRANRKGTLPRLHQLKSERRYAAGRSTCRSQRWEKRLKKIAMGTPRNDE